MHFIPGDSVFLLRFVYCVSDVEMSQKDSCSSSGKSEARGSIFIFLIKEYYEILSFSVKILAG